jgi:hypothetical protein
MFVYSPFKCLNGTQATSEYVDTSTIHSLCKLLSSTRQLLGESYSNDSYQLVCQTYNNTQNNTNNVSSASQQVFAIPNQSVQVLSQPTQTKSLLKPIGRNTNQVAITTKHYLLWKNFAVRPKEKLLNKLKKIVSDQ